MSYAKKFRIPGGSVQVPWDMLNKPAYQDLSPSAAKALPYFLGKVKFGRKSGMEYASASYYSFQFNFSYAEARKYGFATATFNKVIRDLVEKGFLDCVYRGGMRGLGLSFTWFTLSPRWLNYGKPDFQIVRFNAFVPKPRKPAKESCFLPPAQSFPTSNYEINSFKKGNRRG